MAPSWKIVVSTTANFNKPAANISTTVVDGNVHSIYFANFLNSLHLDGNLNMDEIKQQG